MKLRVVLKLSMLLFPLLTVILGCADLPSTERIVPDRGTVGEVVYQILDEEIQTRSSIALSRRAAFDDLKPRFILGVNTLLTWEDLNQVGTSVLEEWIDLVDKGWMDRLLRESADLLNSASTNEELLLFFQNTPWLWPWYGLDPLYIQLHIPTWPSLLSESWSSDLTLLLQWLSLHDGLPNPPFLPQQDAGRLLLNTPVYLSHILTRSVPSSSSSVSYTELWSSFIDFAWTTHPNLINQNQPFYAIPWDASGYPQTLSPISFEDLQTQYTLGTLPFLLPQHPLNLTLIDPLIPLNRSTNGEGIQSDQNPLYAKIDLHQSVMYSLLQALNSAWKANLLAPTFELFLSLLGTPEWKSDPLLGSRVQVYPRHTLFLSISQTILALLNFSESASLLHWAHWVGLKAHDVLAKGVDRLFTLQDLTSEDVLPSTYQSQGEIEWKQGRFLDEFGLALNALFIFTQPVTLSLSDSNTWNSDQVVTLEPHEATIALVAELIALLSNPIFQEFESITKLMLASQALDHGQAPDLDGRYLSCSRQCEPLISSGSFAHYQCMQECPLNEIFATQNPSNLETQSFLERSLALLRDHLGHPFKMRVTQLSVSFAPNLIDLDESLLPPLLEIEDVSLAFFRSVAGSFRLEDQVQDSVLQHPQMIRLLDGFVSICDESGPLNAVINSLLPNLAQVEEDDLHQRCERFNLIHQRTLDLELGLPNTLNQYTASRKKEIALLVTLLSLLTDVPMDEVPTTGQLIRFFNLPDPSLNLAGFSLKIDPLVCAQGYPLHAHHGLALYAGEASGLFDLLRPLIRVFDRYGKLEYLVELMVLGSTHYTSQSRPFYNSRGELIESKQTGLVYAEPALEWILSNLQVSDVLLDLLALTTGTFFSESVIQSIDQSQIDQLSPSSPLHQLDPTFKRAGLLFGPFMHHLLYTPQNQDSLYHQSLRHGEALHEIWHSTYQTEWTQIWEWIQKSVDVTLVGNIPQFNHPQIWVVGALALEKISQLLTNHQEWITDLNQDLEDLITHPLFWSTMSFANHLNDPSQDQVRLALNRLLSPFLDHPSLLLIPLYVGSVYSLFISSSSLSEDFGEWIQVSPTQIDLQTPQSWPFLYKFIYFTHLLIERSKQLIWPQLIEKALTSHLFEWTLSPHFSSATYQVKEYTSPFFLILSSLLPLIHPQPDLNPTWQKNWTAQEYQEALFSLSRWLTHPQQGLVQALEMMQKRIP